MVDTKALEALRGAINEAVKISKRLDKCHKTYLDRTNSGGFSRAVTTSYSANASNLSIALESKLDTVKSLTQSTLNI